MSCNITLCLANRSPRRLRTAAHGSKHIFRAKFHQTRPPNEPIEQGPQQCWRIVAQSQDQVWMPSEHGILRQCPKSGMAMWHVAPLIYCTLEAALTTSRSPRITFQTGSSSDSSHHQPPKWRLNPVLSRPSFATIVVDVTIRADRQ